MKKILTVFAIVFAGLALNAATVSWSLDYSYVAGTTDYAENYLVYFFDNADYARTDAVSKLGNKDTSFTTSGYAATDLTDDEGYVRADGIGNYGNGVNIDGYLVIFNADTIANATLAYVTDIESGATTLAGLPADISFGDQVGTQVADNWTSISGSAVPEPTSGLLVLLGVAGLALRRRRA